MLTCTKSTRTHTFNAQSVFISKLRMGKRTSASMQRERRGLGWGRDGEGERDIQGVRGSERQGGTERERERENARDARARAR